tara:strand:- start:663 stop:2594 length:1932 start_codon:yes stop_codon:yes gene_type:complete
MADSTGSIAFIGATRFQGHWDATRNDGTSSSGATTYATLLVDGGYHSSTNLTASQGDYWQVNTDGTTSINSVATWTTNDWVIYSGSAWMKLDFEDTMASVVVGDTSAIEVFHLTSSNDKQILFVTGNAAAGTVQHSGSTNFVFDYVNTRIGVGVAAPGATLDVDGDAIFNESGADKDFRVESDGNANMLFVDGGSNRVGIGTGTPGADLEIKAEHPKLLFQASETSGHGDGSIVFKSTDGTQLAWIRADATSNALNHLVIAAGTDENDLIVDGTGKVGIGVQDPDHQLEVFSTSEQQKWSYDADSFATLHVADASHTTLATGESGNLTLDVAGDLSLDAGGGDVIFLDDGTEIGRLTNSSSDLVVKSAVSDKDIIFKGNDGGVAVTAMTIDMSEAGRVGIGCTVPEHKLSVTGTLGIGGATTIAGSNRLNLYSTSNYVYGSASGLLLNADGGSIYLWSSNGVRVADDVKLYLGSSSESYIEYNEDGNDRMIISGSKDGLEISGSAIFLDSNAVVSGSAAGGGSYLAVDTTGKMVLTASSGGTVTIANDADNRIVTAVGDGTINGEANLTFDGSTLTVSGDIVPGSDSSKNLGSATVRWANIYTGDLHLKNDRGDWTIVEEEDYLCVINNITGKKYEMLLKEIE